MNKKYWLFIILLVLACLSLFIYALKFARTSQEVSTKALPTELTPTPVLEKTASIYATDSAVLKIEQELEALIKDLETVNLDEDGLKPPALDLQIEY